MNDLAHEPTEVDASFGVDGRVSPLAFSWRGTRLDVLEVGRSWRDADHRRITHVLVRTVDGSRLELRFDGGTLRWTVARIVDVRVFA